MIDQILQWIVPYAGVGLLILSAYLIVFFHVTLRRVGKALKEDAKSRDVRESLEVQLNEMYQKNLELASTDTETPPAVINPTISVEYRNAEKVSLLSNKRKCPFWQSRCKEEDCLAFVFDEQDRNHKCTALNNMILHKEV